MIRWAAVVAVRDGLPWSAATWRGVHSMPSADRPSRRRGADPARAPAAGCLSRSSDRSCPTAFIKAQREPRFGERVVPIEDGEGGLSPVRSTGGWPRSPGSVNT